MSAEQTVPTVQAIDRQRPVAAIGFMVLTMLMFVAMDTIAKSLTASIPTGQVVWARYVFNALLLLLILNRRVVVHLHTSRPWLQLFRSSILLVTTAFFFLGLKYLGLATASSIMFVSPLIVTLLSVPVLGEAVGWRRILSVIAGLIGALIIIRPGSDALGLAALLPLASAIGYATYQLTTRILTRSDSTMTTLLYTSIVGALLSNLALVYGWVWPTAEQWLMMVAMGGFGCLGHFALIRAFTLANAAVAAPFTYTSLIWATLFGYLAFGDLPDLWTVVGAAVIVGAGLYILYRERMKTKGLAAENVPLAD